jgi:hypothetical protein
MDAMGEQISSSSRVMRKRWIYGYGNWINVHQERNTIINIAKVHGQD